MGKSKKKDRAGRRADPVGHRPPKPPTDPETLAIRNQKILPIVEALKHVDTNKRSEAAVAIANLIDDEKCRKLLLREGLVQILVEQTLTDSNLAVRIAGWGVVRNLTLEEGPDFSVHLYRKDILTLVEGALDKVRSAVIGPDLAFKNLKDTEQNLVWELLESLCNVLSSLAASTAEVVVSLSGHTNIFNMQLDLLSSDLVPETLKASLLSYFHIITEDNDFITAKILLNPELWNILCTYQSEISPCGITACGILTNVADLHMYNRRIPSQQKEALNKISFDTIMQTLDGTFEQISKEIWSSWSQLSEKKYLMKPLNTALDVAQAFATVIANLSANDSFTADVELSGIYEGDAAEKNDVDIDFNKMDAISADKGMGMGEIDAMDTMDIVGRDGRDGESATGSQNISTTRLHLMTTTVPLILSFVKSSEAPPPEVKSIINGALGAINNIAWAQPPFTSPSNHADEMSRACQQAWNECVRPVITSNTADVSLASQITALAWALARCAYVEATDDELGKFMALYQASRTLNASATNAKGNYKHNVDADTANLGSACVGLLGTFAHGRDVSIQRNQTIGTFLIKLITEIPQTPVEDAVEALNQIFDIYSDKELAYDGPVFVQCQFLDHLETATFKVQRMTKAIDRRKQPELRGRADDALFNLRDFLTYKRGERNTSTQA